MEVWTEEVPTGNNYMYVYVRAYYYHLILSIILVEANSIGDGEILEGHHLRRILTQYQLSVFLLIIFFSLSVFSIHILIYVCT